MPGAELLFWFLGPEACRRRHFIDETKKGNGRDRLVCSTRPPFFFVGDHFSRAQGSRHVVAELAKKVAGEGPAAACGWLGLGDTTDGEVGLWVPWWLKPPTAHDLLRCNWLFGEIEREVRPRKGPLLVDKEKSRRKIGRRLGGPPGMIHWQQPFSLGPHDWETLGASGWAGCCRYLLLFKD
ncbi:uncharacterized protein BKA78DRAFT_79172 [Phyllosticta capitalensis]|uniref:uncharacterized protein n=1 Tax=Phyllosticta capitalensis TaxID=121624 RepID=UPI00312E7716